MIGAQIGQVLILKPIVRTSVIVLQLTIKTPTHLTLFVAGRTWNPNIKGKARQITGKLLGQVYYVLPALLFRLMTWILHLGQSIRGRPPTWLALELAAVDAISAQQMGRGRSSSSRGRRGRMR